MVSKLDYGEIKFPFSKKDYCKIEKQNNVCINVFCYDNRVTYSVYLSNQEFKDCIDLLLISNQNKSCHVYIKDFNSFLTANENKACYVYIKDFNSFMFSKTKNKSKKVLLTTKVLITVF